MELLLGGIAGMLFGFLLQKGRVLRFEKQVSAVRLADMTIIKFMLSAILVGMAGVYLLKDLGAVELELKGVHLGANILGGLIFGAGWAILGLCPGTSVGALGEGRWHAIWGILGMLAGAALFADVYPALKRTVLTWGIFGKIALPEILHVNHWILIAVFVIAGLLLFSFFEKKGL